MPASTHLARNTPFDQFINSVMWTRANSRIWAGPLGLCFSWQGARGQTFAAFSRGKDVVIYRAMSRNWPPAVFGKLRLR